MRNLLTMRIQPILIADTFALVTFASIVGLFIEVVLSGLTLGQSFQSRLFAIPLNVIVARPYGLYRDWLFTISRAENKGQVIEFLIDIIAFLSFMIPQYIAVLWLVGAEVDQILIACTSVLILSVVIGRPYGLYLMLCRRIIEGYIRKDIGT